MTRAEKRAPGSKSSSPPAAGKRRFIDDSARALKLPVGAGEVSGGEQSRNLDLFGIPRSRDAFGRSRSQQDAHSVPVLAGAFYKLCEGWVAPWCLADVGNADEPLGWGLVSALMNSSQDESLIDTYYARRVLQRLEFHFTKWEAHPARTQEDVLRLVARAIALAGGEAPSIPDFRPALRRGGWRVFSGGRK